MYSLSASLIIRYDETSVFWVLSACSRHRRNILISLGTSILCQSCGFIREGRGPSVKGCLVVVREMPKIAGFWCQE